MTAEELLAQLKRETTSSIELTRNAKGDYQWCCKIYFELGQEDEALGRLSTIDAALRVRFLVA